MGLRQAMERFLPWFLVVQPLLDAATTASLYTLHGPVTVGVVVRVVVLLGGMAYLLTGAGLPRRPRRLLQAYTLLVVGFIAANLVINYLNKPVFSPRLELTYAAKAWYFPTLLLTFATFLQQSQPGFWPAVGRAVAAAAGLTGAVMLTATLTGTALPSYHYPGKAGVSGWYFSANEVSAALALTFPVALARALAAPPSTRTWQNLERWFPIWLVCFGLLALGTKTAYLAGAAALLMVPMARFVRARQWRRRLPQAGRAWLYAATLVFYLGATPWSPVAANTHAHIAWIHPLVHPGATGEGDIAQVADVDELVYSSRDVYLAQALALFSRDPLVQKVFGAGFAGNYEQRPKLVEMDFHDAWFSFGGIGFVLWVLPLTVLLGIAIYRQVRVVHRLPAAAPYWLSVSLGLAVAGLAGHVLTAPAVSIYLAALLPYLIRILYGITDSSFAAKGSS